MKCSLPRSSKRTKNNKSGAYTSLDANVDADPDNDEVHPMGQKASKSKAKGKRKGKGKETESSGSPYMDDEILDKWISKKDEVMNYKDYDIMMKDASNMNPIQLALHEKICAKIREKWGI